MGSKFKTQQIQWKEIKDFTTTEEKVQNIEETNIIYLEMPSLT